MDTRLHSFLAAHYAELVDLAAAVGHEDAREAVHDLAVKLAARPDQGRLARILGLRWKPYLRRALSNLLIDRARTARPHDDPEEIHLPAAPFDELALRREVVDLARLTLDSAEQAIFEMRYVLDVPVAAVSTCTGRSRRSTFRDLDRIRVKLTAAAHVICPDC